MNKIQKELHHFLYLHEWKTFSTPDLEYRYCEQCGRLEFEFDGHWNLSKLPSHAKTSSVYVDAKMCALKVGIRLP